MTDPQSPVRVEYRHALLAESAPVYTADEGVFVALAQPMPVRTTLRLVGDDGNVRTMVVERVVEIAQGSAYGVTGVAGKLVELRDGGEDGRSAVVGSEHLASAELGELPPGHGTAESDGSDGTNAAMAMPAPVVVDDGGDDDSGAYDQADDGGDDEGGDDSSAEADAGASGEDVGEAESDQAPKRRGRRRRGKKKT